MPETLQTRDWAAIRGWIAIILSTLSLLVASAAIYFSVHNFHLASSATISVETNTDTDEPPVGLQIDNDGPGGHPIKSLTYYVDKKPVDDIERAMDFGNLDSSLLQFYDIGSGEPLAPNEKQYLVKFSKPQDKRNQKELDRFTDFIDKHLAVEVEYCSLSGDCKTYCSENDWCK